ncbi:hypothetical protein D3C87_1766860 [compost metagenome]
MPSPNSTMQGSTASHTACIGAVRPRPANAPATISEPIAISGPGPNRSAHLPLNEERTVSAMPSGSRASDTVAGDSPQPPIIVMGRKNMVPPSAK